MIIGEQMSKFSVEKLKNKKKEKCLTNRKISELSGIPLVTIDKLFSGANANPTIQILQKITAVLECTMDDLIDYEGSPMQEYYDIQEISKLAKELHDNAKLRNLMFSAKDLDDSAMDAVTEIIRQIKRAKTSN